MARKIIYLVNPISGTKNKRNLPELIAAKTKAAKIHFEILPTVASGDYKFVKQKIEEENITDVVICGGDGSVNTVTQQLYSTGVNFGIVPLGSGNGLSNTAKIPKDSAKALDVVIKGNASYIDAFTINNEFSCMLCGIGFDAKVAHDFAQQKTRGLLTYAKESFKNFFTAKPYTFELTVNGTKFNTQAFFISIANSNQFGNQFTIAPKASLSDGLLDIVIVPYMNKIVLPLAVLQQVKTGKITSEKEIKNPGITYFQTSHIKIKNISHAPLHIDGEPKETSSSFDIKIIPNCFKLLQPA